MKSYRCSACDRVKHTTNVRYKRWDAHKRPGYCSIVGICQRCAADMKRKRLSRVETYLQRKAS